MRGYAENQTLVCRTGPSGEPLPPPSGPSAGPQEGHARVWGNGSTADSLGERNTTFVWGDDSRAIAGPGIYNNALVFGNNLLADTGPGDGRTVYGQPLDPENQAPVAGTPGAQTSLGTYVKIYA